jgi:hypothetical protein
MAPNSLDPKIRTVVLELVDSAPVPRTLPELDQPSPSRGVRKAPKVRFGFERVRNPWVALVTVSIIVLGAVVLVTGATSNPSKTIPESTSNKTVTEATLGFRLTGYVSAPPPVPKGWPAVFTYVGSGSFFGVPWSVFGASSSDPQLCMGFVFAKSPESWSCTGPRKAVPETEAHVSTGDVTASNGQRFLLVVTNGAITQLRVRASDGETVSASPLPQQLGNNRYFVVSLGKKDAVCSNLCRGPVSITFLTDSGPVDIGNGQPNSIESIGGGFGGYLETPPVTK